MVMAQPLFLLFCDTHVHAANGGDGAAAASRGRWHFVLERLDGAARFEAADSEPAANRERLALLSVVRGLEALEQPSRVTLVTTSRYVSRGLRYGLATWRESDYMWERFGVQMPIRNADLWQRIDGAMQFHGVTCRLIQSEASATAPTRVTEDQVTVTESLAVANPAPALPVPPIAEEMEPTRPAANSHSVLPWQEIWWKLAASWLKWWRGRTPTRPAFYGT